MTDARERTDYSVVSAMSGICSREHMTLVKEGLRVSRRDQKTVDAYQRRSLQECARLGQELYLIRECSD